MKNSIASIFIIALIAVTGANASAIKPASGGKETVEIKTSANCGECKSRIETALFELKGVKTAKLDLKTKTVKVVFNPEKTSVAQIKSQISNTGYDADEVPANAEAYENLPQCCQKNGHQ